MALSTFLTARMKALAPRVIDRREIIQTVADRWRAQYPDTDERYGERNERVRRALEALDLNNATAEDVAAAIGNDSWTRLDCSVCETDRDRLVSVPREFDSPLYVCGHCASGILELLEGAS